jgi:hypothetical protein
LWKRREGVRVISCANWPPRQDGKKLSVFSYVCVRGEPGAAIRKTSATNAPECGTAFIYGVFTSVQLPTCRIA